MEISAGALVVMSVWGRHVFGVVIEEFKDHSVIDVHVLDSESSGDFRGKTIRSCKKAVTFIGRITEGEEVTLATFLEAIFLLGKEIERVRWICPSQEDSDV